MCYNNDKGGQKFVRSHTVLLLSQLVKDKQLRTGRVRILEVRNLTTTKDDQKSQLSSYMSDKLRKESTLKYAENGSDVEKSPDEERIQEIRAISDVGRLSQPGRSSEDEDSDKMETSR